MTQRWHRGAALQSAALFLGVPILVLGGGLLTAYALEGAGSPLPWVLADLTAFSAYYAYMFLATTVAMVITARLVRRRSARALARLQRDPLTGLLNGAGLRVAARRTLAVGGASLALFELSGLEELRRRRGRVEVRALIREAASLLRTASRGRGALLRNGTLALLLPGATAADAEAAAQGLRDRLEGLCADRGVRLRIGVGTAEAGATASELLSSAEEDLDARVEEVASATPFPARLREAVAA